MKADTYQRRNTNCKKCHRFFVIDEINKDECPYCKLSEAHRKGWEQAKAECEAIALDYEQKVYDSVGDPRVGNFTGRIARLIADMEYKEAKDETN